MLKLLYYMSNNKLLQLITITIIIQICICHILFVNIHRYRYFQELDFQIIICETMLK
jgi:hypothetical protein